jgi:hypothetical protein
MQKRPTPEERLEIIRAVDNHPRWYSLDDKWVCAISGKVTLGSRLRSTPTSGCLSNFGHWFLYQSDRKPALLQPALGKTQYSFLPSSDL